jgi:hypothetical protein
MSCILSKNIEMAAKWRNGKKWQKWQKIAINNFSRVRVFVFQAIKKKSSSLLMGYRQ